MRTKLSTLQPQVSTLALAHIGALPEPLPSGTRLTTLRYTPNYAGMPFNGSLVIATYCVPTRPGWVRPLANVLVDREATLGSTLSERALGIFMGGWTPYWLGHVLSSIVLHQVRLVVRARARPLLCCASPGQGQV